MLSFLCLFMWETKTEKDDDADRDDGRELWDKGNEIVGCPVCRNAMVNERDFRYVLEALESMLNLPWPNSLSSPFPV